MQKDVSNYFYGVKEDVSADYKDLAYWLGIPDTRNIESRNRDAKSCCMDVLQTWKREKGDQATVEVLRQALVLASLQSAADNLRRKLGEGISPTTTSTSNKHNVEEPEMKEDTSSDTLSFSCKVSCKVRNFFHSFCNAKVGFGLFYTICVCVYLVSYPTPTFKHVTKITTVAIMSYVIYAEWRVRPSVTSLGHTSSTLFNLHPEQRARIGVLFVFLQATREILTAGVSIATETFLQK